MALMKLRMMASHERCVHAGGKDEKELKTLLKRLH